MIVWVFGGTAVGKKSFIRRAAADPVRFGLNGELREAWMEDGDMSAEQLLEEAAQSPLLVRWQWRRENLLEWIRQERPDVQQSICVVRVDIHVQVQRVINREGSLKWDEWSLSREAEDVQHLVEQLSMRHGIPVRYIDGTA